MADPLADDSAEIEEAAVGERWLPTSSVTA